MNTITLRAELILVFSFLLCLQGVQCVSKSNECIYRGTVYGAETGSIIWRCGLEDVVYRTTVNCSIGKVHHCSLIRQRFTKPSECQGVIHRGNWIYKKSENKCAREPGPFSEEKECQKCVTVYERSPCNCTIDKGQKVDISCPKWKPLLSQYNFTYNAKIHATQYRRDLLGWCGSKETHDEIKGALRDQIDSCKHTSCQLQTVETIYQMIENITSQPNGDQLAPIAQQVQFVGDAVGLLRRKDALDYDVIIPLATSLLRSSDNIVNTLHQNFSERNDLSHKLIGHLEHVTPLMVKALENSEKQFTFTSRNIGMAVTSTNFTPSHTSKVEVFDANGGRTAKLTLYGPGKSQNRTCSGGTVVARENFNKNNIFLFGGEIFL